jgi:hypothetical protein
MKRNGTDFDPDSRKKPRKLDEFIRALLTNPSLEDAARAVGISRTTAWRWLKNPAVIAQLHEARREAWGRALAMLQEAGPEAVQALREVLRAAESESSKVSAAKAVLELGVKVVELTDLQQRIETLEQVAKTTRNWKGPNDDQPPAPAGSARKTNGSA